MNWIETDLPEQMDFESRYGIDVTGDLTKLLGVWQSDPEGNPWEFEGITNNVIYISGKVSVSSDRNKDLNIYLKKEVDDKTKDKIISFVKKEDKKIMKRTKKKILKLRIEGTLVDKAAATAAKVKSSAAKAGRTARMLVGLGLKNLGEKLLK